MICEENNAFTLPRNWLWTSIREASVLVTKGATPTSYDFGFTKQGINFVKVENMANGCVARETIKEFVTQEAHDFLKRSQLAEKDVLFSIAGTIGRVAVVLREDLPANINQAIAIIRCPWRFLNPQYLMTFLDSTWTRLSIQKKPRGVGMNNVSLEDVKNIIFPLAPFNEQVRIVAKLEALFTRLDAGVEGLRKVKAQLKRYRQAVLKYAFEGRLTEKWRKNHRDLIEPAAQLINSIIKANLAEWENDQLLQLKKSRQDQKNNPLKKKYKQPLLPSTSTQAGLPECWAWVTGDQLFRSVTSGSRGWAKYYSGKGAFFVRVGDLSHDNISIDLKSAQHVKPPDGAELRRTRVSSGDILISITADIGRIALVPTGIKEAYINQHVALAKSVSLFNHSYLAWFLLSPIGQKQLAGLQYGATKAGLGLDDIRRVNIPLAPLGEQDEIVEEIERRLSVLTEAEKVIEQASKRANILRQSILKTAFEGRLVPQTPEDEPADRLLERIREEKAMSMDEKNTNKRRKNKPRQLELSSYVK